MLRDGGWWRPQQKLQEVTAWFPLGSPGRQFQFGRDSRTGAGYGEVGGGRV